MTTTLIPGSVRAPRCRLIYHDNTVREGVVRYVSVTDGVTAIRNNALLRRAIIHAVAGAPLWPTTCDWYPVDLADVRFATVLT